jgi:adenine/guanine/hypoxanthine permease
LHCQRPRAQRQVPDWSIDLFSTSPIGLVGIPFSYSIADRLALGFVSYAVVKGLSDRLREISWLAYVLAIVLVMYFVFVRSRMS